MRLDVVRERAHLVAAGLVALALPESAAPARDWHSEPSARPASPDATPRLLTVAATHPHLLLLGGAYGLVKLVRYVALLWLPLYLHEEQALSPAAAGFLSTAFDAGGALGGGLWGMAADHRSLRGRRRDRRLAPRRCDRAANGDGSSVAERARLARQQLRGEVSGVDVAEGLAQRLPLRRAEE